MEVKALRMSGELGHLFYFIFIWHESLTVLGAVMHDAVNDTEGQQRLCSKQNLVFIVKRTLRLPVLINLTSL